MRLEAAAGRLAEHDRVTGLHIAEFGWEGEGGHHVVAEMGAAPSLHMQVLVVDIIEQDGFGHEGPQMVGKPWRRIWSISSRLFGRAASILWVRLAASRK